MVDAKSVEEISLFRKSKRIFVKVGVLLCPRVLLACIMLFTAYTRCAKGVG